MYQRSALSEQLNPRRIHSVTIVRTASEFPKSAGRHFPVPVDPFCPDLEKGSRTNRTEHPLGHLAIGLEKGSGTNSAEHPLGHLAIGS